MFEILGIDPVAELVYRTLLRRQGCRVAELAEDLAIPDEVVRAKVRALAELALVGESFDEEGRVRPVAPDVALWHLIEQAEASLAAKRMELDASRMAIERFVEDCVERAAGCGSADIEHLDGMDQVQHRLEELSRMTRSEMFTFMAEGPQPAEVVEAARRKDEELLRRGVAVRAICQSSIRGDRTTFGYAGWLNRAGGNVRMVSELPVHMVLIDREIAILPVDPGDARAGAVQVNARGVLAGLLALFEHTWTVADPLKPEDDDSEALSLQQRELLALLGQGLTDEAAAKRLGVSQRTVRRMMAGLMQEMGARSRFEAGLKVSGRGWL
ncbi:helix-turn-helix transcriptional regulator [Nonomuraea sp. K274]|uniref:Helix-turn-helix transcriptional regulator n=1 Tax=Nonomuraea cypriaca TaxID=1187855 RepID=A0A931AKM1_9ACTN|nr:LuxR C-terminal-related transcriptional regulator [Nonomuraea cypriaca]MBF8194306.1 helix-turn-helix transcriptional regulator [Nonomuraea cypriaca]